MSRHVLNQQKQQKQNGTNPQSLFTNGNRDSFLSVKKLYLWLGLGHSRSCDAALHQSGTKYVKFELIRPKADFHWSKKFGLYSDVLLNDDFGSW